jgi:hypothetical protein
MKAEQEDLLSKRMLQSFGEFDLEGEYEAKEESVDDPFPTIAFRTSLFSLDSEQMKRILIDYGWTESDLDITCDYMKQLKKERIRFGVTKELMEKTGLLSLDDICHRLIREGISSHRESLILVIPLLPPFDSFQGDGFQKELHALLFSRMEENPEDLFYKTVFDLMAAREGCEVDEAFYEPPGGLD